MFRPFRLSTSRLDITAGSADAVLCSQKLEPAIFSGAIFKVHKQRRELLAIEWYGANGLV